ncbi:hypothetical protein B0G52_10628 [Cohnella sp. SGD-V74]|jgi:hypothetical protein|nr:hypothetical protein B0G52_10628 [Cohnella sp. SGD-V74]
MADKQKRCLKLLLLIAALFIGMSYVFNSFYIFQ